MIPNMFKIAGEQTSTVFHIAARSVATHALSIFGDHSDVMTTRSTGWAMLFGNSVQEVMDFALIAQASTLRARVPFLHVFDGFRTSHEVMKIEKLSDERDSRDDRRATRAGAPSARPDARSSRDARHRAKSRCLLSVARACRILTTWKLRRSFRKTMDKFAALTGRQYHLFEYVGAPDAERVIVMMGSGCEAAEETVDALMCRRRKGWAAESQALSAIFSRRI